MRSTISFFLMLFLFLSPGVQSQEQNDIIIRNVTVIDGTGNPPAQDQTVLVKDGKIA